MGQPPHFDITGAVYFVTTRLKNNKKFFSGCSAEVVQKTISDLSDWENILVGGQKNILEGSRMKENRCFALYAYVIMPNHIHLLLKPINNTLSKIMQLIKGRSSRQINALPQTNSNQSNNLWQKGFFDFTILTEKKFKEKFNYIHYNPVKWSLVEKAEDYKFSSALNYKVKYGEVFYS